MNKRIRLIATGFIAGALLASAFNVFERFDEIDSPPILIVQETSP